MGTTSIHRAMVSTLAFVFVYGAANSLIQFYNRPIAQTTNIGGRDVPRYQSVQCEVLHEFTVEERKGYKITKQEIKAFSVKLHCTNGNAELFYENHYLEKFPVESCDPNLLSSRFLVSTPEEWHDGSSFPTMVTIYEIIGAGYCEYRDYSYENFKSYKHNIPNTDDGIKRKQGRCSVVWPRKDFTSKYKELFQFNYCQLVDVQLTPNVISFRTSSGLRNEFFPTAMTIPEPGKNVPGHEPQLACSASSEGYDFKLLCSKIDEKYVAFIMEGKNKVEKAVVNSCADSKIVYSILPPRYNSGTRSQDGLHRILFKQDNKCVTNSYQCKKLNEAGWCTLMLSRDQDPCPSETDLAAKFHPVKGAFGLWLKCEGPSATKFEGKQGALELHGVGAKKLDK